MSGKQRTRPNRSPGPLKLLWALREDRELTAAQKLVMSMLVAHADADGYCHPGAERLAEECRTSDGAVRRAIRAVEKSGVGPIRVVVRARKRSDGGCTSNVYELSLKDTSDHGKRAPALAQGGGTDPTEGAPRHRTGAPPAPPGGAGPIREIAEDGQLKTPSEDLRARQTWEGDAPEEDGRISEVIEHYTAVWGRAVRRTPTHPGVQRIRERLLEGFTVSELRLAISGSRHDDLFQRSAQYQNLMVILRDSGQVERFMALAEQRAIEDQNDPAVVAVRSPGKKG